MRNSIIEFYSGYVEGEHNMTLDEVASSPHRLYRSLRKKSNWQRDLGSLAKAQYPAASAWPELVPATPYSYYYFGSGPSYDFYHGNYQLFRQILLQPKVAIIDDLGASISSRLLMPYDASINKFNAKLITRHLEFMGLLKPLVDAGIVALVREWTSSRFRKKVFKPSSRPPSTAWDDNLTPFGPYPGIVEEAEEFFDEIDPYVGEYGFSASIPNSKIRDGVMRWLPHISWPSMDFIAGPLSEQRGLPALCLSRRSDLRSIVADVISIRLSEEAFSAWLDASHQVLVAVNKTVETGNEYYVSQSHQILVDKIHLLKNSITVSRTLQMYFGSITNLAVDGFAAFVTGGLSVVGQLGNLAGSAMKSHLSGNNAPSRKIRAVKGAINTLERLRYFVTEV